MSSIDRVAFPPRILDYRNVDRPTMLHQPNTTHVEKEHPNFEVTDARSSNIIKLPLEEFVYLVETLLSFIAFLKYGCGLLKSRPTGSVEYDKALELFLRMVVTTVERGESSNQWYLQKTLEIVHFKQDILSFGPASGFSTETGERGLKSWAKQPSRTAQRRGDEIFSHQVCQRIHEAAILSAIDDSCPLEPTGIGVRDNQPDQYEALGSKFVMQFQANPVIVRLLRSGKKHPIQIEFAKVIEAWFVGNFNTQVPIHIFSEVILPDETGEKGSLVRAHPNFRGEGAWHDFCLMNYDEDGRRDINPVYPSKIVTFFQHPVTKDNMALLQEVLFQSEKQQERDSQLFQHWTLQSRVNRSTKTHDAVLKAVPIQVLLAIAFM